jgi:hypothetical protein
MMQSNSKEKPMLATVSKLRRLFRNADLATKLERVMKQKHFTLLQSSLARQLGVPGVPARPHSYRRNIHLACDQEIIFRNSRRKIFPEGVRGTTSTKRISRGCLCRESRSATKFRNS